MSWTKHNAIIVTAGEGSKDYAKMAHDKAKEIFGKAVTEIIVSDINYYRTFFIGPDGSKEGWEESDAGDEKRIEFLKYIRTLKYEDRSSPVSYVEVCYGNQKTRRSKVVKQIY